MLRTIICVACLILAVLLLVPGGLRLWGFLEMRRATQHIQHLPEPQAEIIMSVTGRVIDSDTVPVIATVICIAFVLAAFGF